MEFFLVKVDFHMALFDIVSRKIFGLSRLILNEVWIILSVDIRHQSHMARPILSNDFHNIQYVNDF